MRLEATALQGVVLVHTRHHEDDRGWFAETFRTSAFADAGIDVEFVQENHAYSAAAGVVRGLHFQTAPHAQAKLVRVVRGAIFDVVVDLRPGASFGQHLAVELAADSGLQLFVPEGFAHGYQTLKPHTEVLYKVSRYYAPSAEGGLLWEDPALGIRWPVRGGDASLSDRDRRWPTLAELSRAFD